MNDEVLGAGRDEDARGLREAADPVAKRFYDLPGRRPNPDGYKGLHASTDRSQEPARPHQW